MIEESIRRAGWGAPHCPGVLHATISGDRANIACDLCGPVVVSVPAADVEQTLDLMARTKLTTIPHQDFGDPECCGCLEGVTRADEPSMADVTCGECGAVIRSVPTAALEQTFSEMELTLEIATEMCPHCGSVNVMSGFSKVLVYTWRNCGRVVRLSSDPEVDSIFGPADEGQ